MAEVGYVNLDGGDVWCNTCYAKYVEEETPLMYGSMAYGEVADGFNVIDTYVGPVSIFETCSQCDAYINDLVPSDELREAHAILCERGMEYRKLTRSDFKSSKVRKAYKTVLEWTCFDLLKSTCEQAFAEQ